ncbi:MAG: hypothetical protein IPO08_02865 [Xanthomonadales bacterium]|nr:hypothetical protein [Xanthomonadales bacterium]
MRGGILRWVSHGVLSAVCLCGMLQAQASPRAAKVAPPNQPGGSFSLLGEENHRQFPLQMTGAYLFIEGAVDGLAGAFLLDTGTPYPVFLNNALLPLALDHYVATGRSGASTGNAGREQVVYAHSTLKELRISDQRFTAPGVLLSSNFGYIADMDNGGIRPDLLGFVGLPMLYAHEFVLDYSASTLDVYRLDEQGNALIPHADDAKVIATLAFHRHRDATIGGHLPFVDINIAGMPFVGLLDNGTPGELALTAKTKSLLEARQALQKAPNGWHLCHANYRGIPLRLDTPTLRISEHDSISLGHNLLRHYRSVWNYAKQTVTLLADTTSGGCTP